MTIFLRLFAWLLAAAVTFATLGPPRYRPHAAITHDGEHALAFVLLGIAFAVAYPRQRMLVAALSVVLIGVLELLQLFVPGRHARLEDFWSMRWLPSSALPSRQWSTGWCGRAGARRRSDRKSPAGRAARGAFRPSHYSMILMTLRVRGSTITRRSLTTA